MAWDSQKKTTEYLLYDDFSIPLAAGSINGTYTTYNGVTNSEIARTIVDTQSKIDIEAPVSVWPIGDSKTAGGSGTLDWPSLLTDATHRYFELPARFATSGWKVANIKNGIDAYLLTCKNTPCANVLFNIGANDVAGTPTSEESFKADWQYVVNAIHDQYPSAKIFVPHIYRSDQPASCAILNGWLDTLIAANSSFCFAGMDETTWLVGATITSDGVHPNTLLGAQTCAAQWMTILNASANTTPLPIGMYFRYKWNSNYGEQTFKHAYDITGSAGTSNGKVTRYKLSISKHNEASNNSIRIDNGNLSSYIYNQPLAMSPKTSTVYYSMGFSDVIYLYIVEFRGYAYYLVESNGVLELIGMNDSQHGSPIQYLLNVKDSTFALYQVAIPKNAWLPTPIILDGFTQSLVSDGTNWSTYPRTDYLGASWPNGSGVAWNQTAGSWGVTAGTLKCSTLASGVGIATIATTSPNYVIACKVSAAGGGIVLRYVDANNYMYATATATAAELHKVVGGVDSIVKTHTLTTGNYLQQIYCNGPTVAFIYNVTQVSNSPYTVTDSVLLTGATIGFRTTDVNVVASGFHAYHVSGHDSIKTLFGTPKQ